MGLEITGQPPSEWPRLIGDLIADKREVARKAKAAERVKLYRDDYAQLLAWTLAHCVFTDPEVYRRIERLIPLVGGTSFLKRIADELGRPLYARAPLRRVVMPGGKDAVAAQDAYNEIVEQINLDENMNTISRLITASNAAFGFLRYVEDIGLQLDVVTPNNLTVKPDPRVPLRAMAMAYTLNYHDGRPNETVVWDDKRYFTIGPRAGLRGKMTTHDVGMLPFLEVHQRGRTDCYWQETVGEDIVSQAKQSLFFDIVVVKKVKSQSHIQLIYNGDMAALVKDQIPDEDSILLAQGGTLSPISLESDPMKIIETKQANEAGVAAGYGISRDRLNQKGGSDDDVALYERTAELAGIMVKAEVRLFELVKRISREDPKYAGKIPDDAKLLVDLGLIHERVDRKTQLDIRQTERKMGVRSGVDDVLEDNPEFGGNRKLAMKFIDEKMAEEASIIEKRRALNIADDATSQQPGQSPAQNGAMGPKVKAGEMTEDDAAKQSKGGVDLNEEPSPDESPVAQKGRPAKGKRT